MLFRRGDAPAEIAVSWSDLGWEPATRATVRDLWARSDVATVSEGWSATVPAHAVRMVRISPLGS